MENAELTAVVEALLFSAPGPLTMASMLKAIDDRDVDRTTVKNAIATLRDRYDSEGSGIELKRLGNGYQVLTRARFSARVENLLRTRRRARLSRAGLETIAVVAYKQPLSRIEIERIRGVDAGGVLTTLMERGLIMIKGRDPGPGRPLLYGTTQAFLEYFGLTKVSDLPRLDELAALAGIEKPAWSEAEQARFEKHGVDLESVPTPEAALHPAPGEAETSEVQNDPAVREGSAVPEDFEGREDSEPPEAAGAGEDPGRWEDPPAAVETDTLESEGEGPPRGDYADA
jgi:segregation and condensation protein B